MTRRRKQPAPRYIVTPDKRIIPRDESEHETWLALHTIGDRGSYESQGGAYLVSRNGDRQLAVFVPKSLLEIGEPHGAIESTNWRKQPPQLERALVYPASGPGFVFDEKGLR